MNSKALIKNEISLGELIKVLIRRKFWFIGIFLTVLLISATFAYIKQLSLSHPIKQVRYTSYYSLGHMAPGYTLEPLVAVALELREIYGVEANPKFPLDVSHDIYNMGNIIKLMTVVGEVEDSEEVEKQIKELHNKVLLPLLTRHNNLVSTIRQNTGNSSGNPIPSSIISLAQKTKYTLEPSKLTPKLILIIGVLCSFLFGILGVLIMEFIISLKEEIKGNTSLS